jgi:hypothetical protein
VSTKTETTTIDQSQNTDQWYYLGTFVFDTAPSIKIYASALPDIATYADAVKLHIEETGEDLIEELTPENVGTRTSGTWSAQSFGYRGVCYRTLNAPESQAWFPFTLAKKSTCQVYIYIPSETPPPNPNTATQIDIEGVLITKDFNYSLTLKNGEEFVLQTDLTAGLVESFDDATRANAQEFITTEKKALDGKTLNSNPRITGITLSFSGQFSNNTEEDLNILFAKCKEAEYLNNLTNNRRTRVIYKSSTMTFTQKNQCLDGTLSVVFTMLDGYWEDIETTEKSVQALQIGDNDGDDDAWIISKQRFILDTEALYEIECRIKKANGAGAYSAGVFGYASDGTTKVNADGDNDVLKQYFVAAFNQTETDWTTYKGYLKSTSIPGDYIQHNDPGDPGTVHDNVFYISPMVRGNFNDQTGNTYVDYIKLTNVTTGAVLFFNDFTNYIDETELLTEWDKVETGELLFANVGETILIENETGIRFPIDFTLSVPTGQDLELAPITIENETYSETYTMTDSFGPIGKKGPKTVDSVYGVIKLDGVDESSGLAPGSVWPIVYYGDNIFTIEKNQEDLEVSVKYKRRWFL